MTRIGIGILLQKRKCLELVLVFYCYQKVSHAQPCRNEILKQPIDLTLSPQVWGEAEAVEDSLDHIVSNPKEVPRDIADWHQIITKIVNVKAMLSKRFPHPGLTTRGRQTQVSGNCLCELCLTETIVVRQGEYPALTQLIQLRMYPDWPCRLIRIHF